MEKVIPEFAEQLLSRPNLHDAEILEISEFDFKKRIFSMRLQDEEGQDWHIWFKGVRSLNISDVFHQNIIFGVSVFKNEKIPKDYKKFIEQFTYADKDLSKLMLVDFAPASGAGVFVICENFEIFKL